MVVYAVCSKQAQRSVGGSGILMQVSHECITICSKTALVAARPDIGACKYIKLAPAYYACACFRRRRRAGSVPEEVDKYIAAYSFLLSVSGIVIGIILNKRAVV